MSIVNYGNRVKFKKKSAMEIEFHKSSDFKIPPGYRSMDICIVGGGASGLVGITTQSHQTNESSNSFIKFTLGSPSGGNGGYVRNLYNKEVNTDEIFVKIGNGGFFTGFPEFYYDSKRIKIGPGEYVFEFTEWIQNINTCYGEDTYIKDNRTNLILYSCPGAKGFCDFKGRNHTNCGIGYQGEYERVPAGGGNLGGNSTISAYIGKAIINRTDQPYHFPKRVDRYTAPYSGCTQGYPYWDGVAKYDSLVYTTKYSAKQGSSYSGIDTVKTIDWPIVVGNKMINIEGYGETRIFNTDRWLAGGGCAHDFFASDRNTSLNIIGSYSGDYTNTDGGGESAIIKRNNDDIIGNWDFEIIRGPGNGKPNTGGGGASGVSYVTKNLKPDLLHELRRPGNGGSGLCIIRFYIDENRPDINFVKGVNSFVIE